MIANVSSARGIVDRLRAVLPARPAIASSALIVLSRSPLDGDTTWNALRLAATLASQHVAVRVFVMNDATDLVRQGAMPEGAEFDLQGMLRSLLAHGGRVKVCTTCVTRCGMQSGDVMPEVVMATTGDLATWVVESDRAMTF
jgi:uncharacterized protein involved in oxidation of intracellular sulfur